MGLLTAATTRDLSVRYRSGRVANLPMGQCVPVTPLTNMASRLNEPFIHFISLEVKNDGLLDIFKEKLKSMQESLAQVPDIGKPTKSGSVHITVATLRMHDLEIETVSGMVETAVRGYVEMLNSSTGLVVSFQGVGFGDDFG